jgi:hypothetical protein
VTEYPDYDRFNARVFDSVVPDDGEPGWILVDSSKTAWDNALRPFSLVRAGLDLKMIHLVRDGRAPMWSYLSKGSNRKIEQTGSGRVLLPGLRSAFGWHLANRAAERFVERFPDAGIRVRYEDLMTEPRVTLERIGEFLQLDLTEQITALQAGDPLPRTHQVAGNRMRGAETVRLEPDLGWKQRLPDRYRLLFRIMNGRMARRYGYSGETTPRNA